MISWPKVMISAGMLVGLNSCSPDPTLVCDKHNDSTILLNAPTNERIDDPSALTTDVSLGTVTPAFIDLVNESHAQSSTPMPEQVYLTVVDNKCGKRPNGAASSARARKW